MNKNPDNSVLAARLPALVQMELAKREEKEPKVEVVNVHVDYPETGQITSGMHKLGL